MYRKIPIEELEKFYIINSNGSIIEKSTGKSLYFNKNTVILPFPPYNTFLEMMFNAKSTPIITNRIPDRESVGKINTIYAALNNNSTPFLKNDLTKHNAMSISRKLSIPIIAIEFSFHPLKIDILLKTYNINNPPIPPDKMHDTGAEK